MGIREVLFEKVTYNLRVEGQKELVLQREVARAFQQNPWVRLGNLCYHSLFWGLLMREPPIFMTSLFKLQHENNSVMSLISLTREERIHGLGAYSDSQAVELSSLRIMGKSEFYRALEEPTWTPGRMG